MSKNDKDREKLRKAARNLRVVAADLDRIADDTLGIVWAYVSSARWTTNRVGEHLAAMLDQPADED